MILYRPYDDSLSSENLSGFFVGWPDPPSPETLLQILQGSTFAELAVDDTTGSVVGFVTAVSDRILSAYIPLLEVQPDFQGQGIGSTLLRRILKRCEGLYMVDAMCDPDLQSFYSSACGMQPSTGVMLRRREYQSGNT